MSIVVCMFDLWLVSTNFSTSLDLFSINMAWGIKLSQKTGPYTLLIRSDSIGDMSTENAIGTAFEFYYILVEYTQNTVEVIWILLQLK